MSRVCPDCQEKHNGSGILCDICAEKRGEEMWSSAAKLANRCIQCRNQFSGDGLLCFSCAERCACDLSKIEAIKHDSDKLPLDLLPFEALEGIAEVLKHGAKRYAPNNWRAGFIWSRPFAALLRHLFAFWKGEDIDPDSGLHHLDHAGCELLFLISFVKTKTGQDDRYVKTSS